MKQIIIYLTLFQIIGAAAVAQAESAPLRLVVEPGGARHEVTLGLENQGEEPVRIYVDPRLTRVELRGERGRLGFCRAPADALPRRPVETRFVELAPGQRASDALDLRFLCWGWRQRRLEQAQAVRLTYRARFASNARGQEVWTGRLGPVEVALSEAESAPEQDADAEQAPTTSGDDGDPPLELRWVGRRPDVGSGSSLRLSLELRGPQRDRVPVAVRYELFAFQVTAPSGRAHICRLGPSRVHPLRDFYDRLGRRRVRFELASYCPEGALSESGIYEIRPEFHACFDGQDVGLEAWTGVLVGDERLARARRGRRNASVHVENRGAGDMAEGGQRDAR